MASDAKATADPSAVTAGNALTSPPGAPSAEREISSTAPVAAVHA